MLARSRARALRHAQSIATYYLSHPGLNHTPRVEANRAGQPMVASAPRGPNRLSNPRRIPPGHANQQRLDIYNQHVQAIRERQTQNPNWIGGRARDPNLTQQSMEDFISRHGGPSSVDPRTGQRLRRDAAGRGVTNWDYLGDYGKH